MVASSFAFFLGYFCLEDSGLSTVLLNCRVKKGRKEAVSLTTRVVFFLPLLFLLPQWLPLIMFQAHVLAVGLYVFFSYFLLPFKL